MLGFLLLVVSLFCGILFCFVKANPTHVATSFSAQEIAKLQLTDIPKELQNPESLSTGKVYFLTHCEYCHGLQGQGTRRAPDLTDKKWIHGDGSFNSMVSIIKEGVPNTMMLNWNSRLREDDIKLIAAYVRAMRHD